METRRIESVLVVQVGAGDALAGCVEAVELTRESITISTGMRSWYRGPHWLHAFCTMLHGFLGYP